MKPVFNSKQPKLVGIINITPDSFSDGGRYFFLSSALARFEELIALGVSIIDVGAESTGPRATLIDAEEEWSRLDSFLHAITKIRTDLKEAGKDIKVSVDTRKAEIAEKSLELGISIVNDVSGCSDPMMLDVISKFENSQIIIGHHRGIPPALENLGFEEQERPEEGLKEILSFFKERIDWALKANVKKNQIILDPGLGFGKGTDENLYIIKNLRFLKEKFELPVMIGASKKRFVRELFGESPEDIIAGTAQINALARENGADFVRTHDVSSCFPDFFGF